MYKYARKKARDLFAVDGGAVFWRGAGCGRRQCTAAAAATTTTRRSHHRRHHHHRHHDFYRISSMNPETAISARPCIEIWTQSLWWRHLANMDRVWWRYIGERRYSVIFYPFDIRRWSYGTKIGRRPRLLLSAYTRRRTWPRQLLH